MGEVVHSLSIQVDRSVLGPPRSVLGTAPNHFSKLSPKTMAEQKGSQKGVVALWLLFCAHGLPIPKYGVDEPWGEEHPIKVLALLEEAQGSVVPSARRGEGERCTGRRIGVNDLLPVPLSKYKMDFILHLSGIAIAFCEGKLSVFYRLDN